MMFLGRGQFVPAIGLLERHIGPRVMSVSYTHLTLPTSDLVQISVVAVSLKKKTTQKQWLGSEIKQAKEQEYKKGN